MSRTNNDIKYNDLLNLIANEVGGNSSTRMARVYLNAIINVILKELKLNSRISIMNFGIFETFKIGGYDARIGNFDGGSSVRYIKPKLRLKFSPSKTLDKAINENDFEIPERKKKGRSKRDTRIVHNARRRVEKPTMEDIVTEMLNKK